MIRPPDGVNANSLDVLIQILERFPGETPAWVELNDSVLIDLELIVNTENDDLAALLRTWHGIASIPVV